MYTDEQGNPKFTNTPLYQVNNVDQGELEIVMANITTIIEAVKILQPDQSVGVFSVENLDQN